MKVLYISPVPFEGAGCRFRIYQYLPYLAKEGIQAKVSPFLFWDFFRIAYRRGMTLRKCVFFLVSCLRRLYDLFTALGCDAVVVYRESFPCGPAVFEFILHLFGKKLVFDFDDAIFLPDASEINRVLLRLRLSNNAGRIIKMSSLVIAGNDYLKEYALKFNCNVKVIPTVIDTERFKPAMLSSNEKIVVGWIGTISTQKYTFYLQDVFRELLNKYPGVEIRIIGAETGFLGVGGVTYRQWSLKREVYDIQEFTIGVMPLPDTDWAKGKCAFKIIQYMSLGIPAVASRVGANSEVIQDGINGFLASSPQEWVRKISSLIEQPQLRKKVGLAARKSVEENYSLKRHGPEYAKAMIGVLNEN